MQNEGMIFIINLGGITEAFFIFSETLWNNWNCRS